MKRAVSDTDYDPLFSTTWALAKRYAIYGLTRWGTSEFGIARARHYVRTKLPALDATQAEMLVDEVAP